MSIATSIPIGRIILIDLALVTARSQQAWLSCDKILIVIIIAVGQYFTHCAHIY